MTWGGKGSKIEAENPFIDAHVCWGSPKGSQQNWSSAGDKNSSYLFQTAYRCSLVRHFLHGFWLVKSFPSKNNLCPDTVASKYEDFSANIFVKPPSPILAELPVSTRIYITFFTKRSVNSEGSLQTARPTDGCEEKCYRQKHPWTFPNLKVILKPLSVSKLFCFMLSLCQSFFPREAM